MYQVTVYHHDKDIVKGDLEDKIELIAQENFKTKTAAKDWIKRELGKKQGKSHVYWSKGDKPSYCYVYTGVTWQHENSGEMMEEYYQYALKKVKLK